MAKLNYPKTEYLALDCKKICMSQMFDENARLVPYTQLTLNDKDKVAQASILALELNSKVKITGFTKGRGFTGAMKRWDFAGGPATHGQKNRQRSVGSIGAQGDGRVIKGRKMPGHYGNEKISLQSYFLGFDLNSNVIKVRGSIPGARNSKVLVYVKKQNEN